MPNRQDRNSCAFNMQHWKRYPGRSCPLLTAQYPGHVWSYDFVMDSTVDGKRLKLLTVIDEFNKQAFPIECRRSMTSGDVVPGSV